MPQKLLPPEATSSLWEGRQDDCCVGSPCPPQELVCEEGSYGKVPNQPQNVEALARLVVCTDESQLVEEA